MSSNKLNKKINILLKALEINKGIIYCLDKRQYYSELLSKRCTKYILHRQLNIVDENGKLIKENHEFYRQIDVVLFLVEQLER